MHAVWPGCKYVVGPSDAFEIQGASSVHLLMPTLVTSPPSNRIVSGLTPPQNHPPNRVTNHLP